jgi:serine-aspartate repeat-containing protein C/D/E
MAEFGFLQYQSLIESEEVRFMKSGLNKHPVSLFKGLYILVVLAASVFLFSSSAFGMMAVQSLGDFVWQDLDADGIQDDGEPGIDGVTVNLYDCANNLIDTTTTDQDGLYLFDELDSGNYAVEFVLPDGYVFGPQDQGDDAVDSDADPDTGQTECTYLDWGETDLTWDAGMFPAPTCSLTVYKYCYVPEPPSGDFVCTKPIDSLIMIWDGDQDIRIKAWKGAVGSMLLRDISLISNGQEVTVSGYAGSPNDVIWEIFEAGTDNKIGESTFHLSCSDGDMNGPEDCGKYQGDGKEKAGYINQWILAGMVDSQSSFNCFGTDPSTDPVSECEVTLPSQVECDGKLKALTLKYLGGDCSNTTNWQDGKVTCSGDAGTTEPVRIVITKDTAELTVFPSDETIMIGDEFTIVANNELRADTQFDIVQGDVVLQSLKIHTSCSQPLRLGDRFGSVQVVAMDLKDGDYLATGADVEYSYVIKNTGLVEVQNITVVDDVIGELPGSPIDSLAPGEEVTLEITALVEETVTNTVMVNGETTSGGVCSAEAFSTVTVVVPQPECIVSSASKLGKVGKREEDKVEWELFNHGSDAITIDTITLSWPAALGKLRKIKLDRDTIYEPTPDDRPAPPFAVFDTWKGGVDKRQIKANDRDKLKFEFEKKAKTSQNDFLITVDFLEGCSVEFDPEAVPFD